MKFAVITGTRRRSSRLKEEVTKVVLPPGTVLLVGDAPGCDAIARSTHAARGGRSRVFDAYWGLFGNDAGPVRNSEMVGAAVELRNRRWVCVGCWAFPDEKSKGTHDCAQKLRKAGFEVTEIEIREAELPGGNLT